MDRGKRDVLLEDPCPFGGLNVSNPLSRINPHNRKTPETAMGPDQLTYVWLSHAKISPIVPADTVEVRPGLGYYSASGSSLILSIVVILLPLRAT
jgi:hypothetical protein